MIRKILKPFLGKGFGGFLPIKYASRIFVFLFNPFMVNGSKLYLPIRGIQVLTGFEPEMTWALKKMVKKGNVVVDIGAYFGYFSVLMAKLVERGGVVYSFEPASENFWLLKKNKEINRYNNMVLEKKAVSDKSEKRKLYLWGDGLYHRLYDTPEGSAPFEEIETISLDDYFKDYFGKIDLVVIDVPGSEGAVILGMQKILARFPDIKLLINYSPKRIKEYGHNPITSLNILNTLGFKIWRIRGGLETLEFVSRFEELVKDDTTKKLFCKKLLRNR